MKERVSGAVRIRVFRADESSRNDPGARGVRVTAGRGPEERDRGSGRSALDYRSGDDGGCLSWLLHVGQVPARAAKAAEGCPCQSGEG
jgi:hypothetical protein